MTSAELIAATEDNLIRASGRYARGDTVAGTSLVFLARHYADELRLTVASAERDQGEVDHWRDVSEECDAITRSASTSEAAERANALVDRLTYGVSP